MTLYNLIVGHCISECIMGTKFRWFNLFFVKTIYNFFYLQVIITNCNKLHGKPIKYKTRRISGSFTILLSCTLCVLSASFIRIACTGSDNTITVAKTGDHTWFSLHVV